MARAQQHQYPDSLRSLWTFYQTKQPCDNYTDIYLTVSADKIAQLQQAFSQAPISALAQVVSQLKPCEEQRGLDFDAFLTSVLPAKRYIPLVLAIPQDKLTPSFFT